jgi:TolA-binding protein
MSWLLVSAQDWNALMAKVDAIAASVARIDQTTQADIRMEAQMAQTLDDILADISDLGSKEDGLVTLIHGLKDQIAAAIPPGTLTPEQQSKVDAIFAAVEQRKQAVQAALDENTPPSPPADSNAPPVDPNAPQVNPLSQHRK